MLRALSLSLALLGGLVASLPAPARADWVLMTSAGPVTYRIVNGQLYAYGSNGVLSIYQWSPVFGRWELVTVGTWAPAGVN